MNLKNLLAGVAFASFTAAGASAGVVYQSVPDLFAAPTVNAWCSDCYGGGTFEPLDPFTLSAGATITGVNYMAQDYGAGAASPVTLEIYDSTHSTIVFSQAINPTIVAPNGYGDYEVTAALTGLNLAAGDYWFGVVGPSYALPGYAGGNGGLIDTTPHTGVEVSFLGGNTGYQLLDGGVPEPTTWARMLLGVGGIGGLTRSSRRRLATV
jgi:hypothetical protein